MTLQLLVINILLAIIVFCLVDITKALKERK